MPLPRPATAAPFRPAPRIAGCAMVLALLAPAAHAQGPAQSPAQSPAAFAATTLNVSATGEAAAAPDMAVLSFGVQAQAPTAAEALRQDNLLMNRVLEAVRRAGVTARDVQTSGLGIQAQYAFPQGQPQRLTGYQASNQVTVTVQDLARLGPLVDAVVAAGVNDLGGVRFSLKDATAVEDQARQEAVRALKAKADLYAQASGYRVARLVNLTEGSRAAPAPFAPAEVMLSAARKTTPVQTGELKVRVEVSATFELTR